MWTKGYWEEFTPSWGPCLACPGSSCPTGGVWVASRTVIPTENPYLTQCGLERGKGMRRRTSWARSLYVRRSFPSRAR